jgi:hypothetical protein
MNPESSRCAMLCLWTFRNRYICLQRPEICFGNCQNNISKSETHYQTCKRSFQTEEIDFRGSPDYLPAAQPFFCLNSNNARTKPFGKPDRSSGSWKQYRQQHMHPFCVVLKPDTETFSVRRGPEDYSSGEARKPDFRTRSSHIIKEWIWCR